MASPALPMVHGPSASTLLTSSIPLHCNICPTKSKTFSDVSHLLTHISSKGHLSRYYKTKLKSFTDHASLQLIDEYDGWYAAWGIEALMSARLEGKERKQNRRHPVVILKNEPETTPERYVPAHQSIVDPSLSQVFIKSENSSQGTTPYPCSQIMYSHYPGYCLPFQPWAHMSYTYAAPSLDGEYTEAVLKECAWTAATPEPDLAVDDSTPSSEEGNQQPSPCNEGLKLKGVFWPGMDLFDSATTEMKRKRNQKKSDTAVDHLEFMSRQVRADERKYSSLGDLILTREITGFPDSDSINGDDAPTPAKKPRRPAVRKPHQTTTPRPTRRKKPARKVGADDATVDVSTAPRKRARKTRAKTVNDRLVDAEEPAAEFVASPVSLSSPRFFYSDHMLQTVEDTLGRWRHENSYIESSEVLPDLYSLESSLFPGWDFGPCANDVANPLFIPAGELDFDEQTVSAAMSEY